MIGFRVDANEKIATGHLMRCIAIAEACKKQEKEVLFFLAEDKETQRLKDRNLPYKVLHSRWDDLESEESLLGEALEQNGIEYLVVDSYQATTSYLQKLNQKVPVLYIDDFEDEIYPVSAVLRYGGWTERQVYAERYRGTNTAVLAGMQYVPLRDEFQNQERSVNKKKSILITTGGTDSLNVTGRLLRQLVKKEKFQPFTFCAVVGSMNVYAEELKEMAEQDSRIALHYNVRNMSELMGQCELAVSAAGTTLYELCAMGIPTVSFAFVDNQYGFAQKADENHIMIYAGDARYNDGMIEEICKDLLFYIENPERRKEYSFSMKQLIDGKGAERIAMFLCGK